MARNDGPGQSAAAGAGGTAKMSARRRGSCWSRREMDEAGRVANEREREREKREA